MMRVPSIAMAPSEVSSPCVKALRSSLTSAFWRLATGRRRLSSLTVIQCHHTDSLREYEGRGLISIFCRCTPNRFKLLLQISDISPWDRGSARKSASPLVALFRCDPHHVCNLVALVVSVNFPAARLGDV